MTYRIAEKFKSVQGEGVYAGTPMAFIRFVGCSVGKTICQHCDTDFDKPLEWRGGGEFSGEKLLLWSEPYTHYCFTGGEPLNQDLRPLLHRIADLGHGRLSHIETSGTTEYPDWFPPQRDTLVPVWVCVSPKPGWHEQWIERADEVKVIVPGLGEITAPVLDRRIKIMKENPGVIKSAEELWQRESKSFRWPTLADALRWAAAGKIVFLQPRNAKNDVDKTNLMYCQDLVRDYPQLRLSVQLHKILKVQ